MMQDATEPNPPASTEAPWTDYADTVVASWRFVVYGCLLAWVAILTAAVLVPRDDIASAAVSLPDLMKLRTEKGEVQEEREKRLVPLVPYERLAQSESAKRTGVPIAFYKEIERTLADEAVLQAGLGSLLDPKKIARILADFKDHFATLTTNPRNELERIQPYDGVTGVMVTYETHPPERARAVVGAMAGLVRQAFVTTLARHEMQQQMFEASRHAAQARQDHLNLTHANLSLERQAADLARLVKEAPADRGPQPQVMVNTQDRGYLYVSAGAQLVGVKAAMAENEHLIRTFQREAAVGDLKVAFLRRVDARLQEEGGGGPVQPDVARILREEAEAFLKDKSGPEAEFLRAEALGLSDILVSAASAARVVQSPTLQRKPRAWLVGLGLAAAAMVVVLASILRESWRRAHHAQGLRALNDAA